MFDLNELTELTENEKDELARDCGYSEERRVDKIKEGIGESEYDKDKENSIHRKMLKAFMDKIVFGKEIPSEILTEFMKYFEDIESIKVKAKQDLENEQK